MNLGWKLTRKKVFCVFWTKCRAAKVPMWNSTLQSSSAWLFSLENPDQKGQSQSQLSSNWVTYFNTTYDALQIARASVGTDSEAASTLRFTSEGPMDTHQRSPPVRWWDTYSLSCENGYISSPVSPSQSESCGLAFPLPYSHQQQISA